MRNVALKDLTWLAKIEYKNHPDSMLHIAATDAPDILTALARVYSHVRDCWPYEIISLEQKSNKALNPTCKTAGRIANRYRVTSFLQMVSEKCL